MYKKTMTYTDYNGIERTEDFYFNFTKAELLEMEMSTSGGYIEMLNRIINAKDGKMIIQTFKEFVLKAYGEKSADGRAFLKEDEFGRPLSAKFKQTEAYSDLYMELALDDVKAAEFVNAVIPAEYRQKVEAKKAIAANQ